MGIWHTGLNFRLPPEVSEGNGSSSEHGCSIPGQSYRPSECRCPLAQLALSLCSKVQSPGYAQYLWLSGLWQVQPFSPDLLTQGALALSSKLETSPGSPWVKLFWSLSFPSFSSSCSCPATRTSSPTHSPLYSTSFFGDYISHQSLQLPKLGGGLLLLRLCLQPVTVPLFSSPGYGQPSPSTVPPPVSLLPNFSPPQAWHGYLRLGRERDQFL